MTVALSIVVMRDVTHNWCHHATSDRQLSRRTNGCFRGRKQFKAFFGIERAARLKLDRVEAAIALKDLTTTRRNHNSASRFTRENTWPKNLTPWHNERG